jgi:hypothetical protein
LVLVLVEWNEMKLEDEEEDEHLDEDLDWN